MAVKCWQGAGMNNLYIKEEKCTMDKSPKATVLKLKNTFINQSTHIRM